MRDYEAVPRSIHDSTHHVLRAMLTELRRRKGVTQVQLASLLGLPQSYVSKYEIGERRIDVVETIKICRALDTDPVTFVRKLIKQIESGGGRTSTNPRNSTHGRR